MLKYVYGKFIYYGLGSVDEKGWNMWIILSETNQLKSNFTDSFTNDWFCF